VIIRHAGLIALVLCCLNFFPAHAGSLYICAVNNNLDDWNGMWAWETIHLPAGSAFDSNQTYPDTNQNWKNSSGVMTTSDLTLTRTKPCGYASAKAIIFSSMGWNVSPIYENGQSSFYLYGVIKSGVLITSFGELNAPPADGFQAGVELYQSEIVGRVEGVLNETITLNEDDQ
jgi:hypothetical protein